MCALHRLGSVLHQDAGGGQPGAPGGGVDAALAARRRELGRSGQQEDVALRERPRSHHHRQVCAVPGRLLPGVPAGQHLLFTFVVVLQKKCIGAAPVIYYYD